MLTEVKTGEVLSSEVVRYELTGLVIDGPLDYAQWDALGESLAMFRNASPWWLGDWYNAGEAKFGDRALQAKAIAEAVEEGGLNTVGPRTVQEYAYVAKRFPLQERIGKLTFGHHAILRAHDRARELLKQAADGGWTIAKLKQALKPTALERKRKPCGVVWASPPWERGVSELPEALAGWDLERAVVFLQVGPRWLDSAMQLLEAWELKYQSHFVHYDPSPQAKPDDVVGGWQSVRDDHGLVLLATGRLASLVPAQVSSWLELEAVTDKLVAKWVDALVPERECVKVRAWGPNRKGWVRL
jgi:hypothetical protein